MNERATHLIATLGLRPHPEGGYYREIFRSRDEVGPANGRGSRSALTTIYFLLVEGMHSQWHQVASDEAWHLYEGGPLELLELDASASVLSRHRLEPLGDGSGAPVHVVPSGHWQAARPLGPYALVGCTVGPGFDFADFRMLRDDRELLSIVRARFPDLPELGQTPLHRSNAAEIQAPRPGC